MPDHTSTITFVRPSECPAFIEARLASGRLVSVGRHCFGRAEEDDREPLTPLEYEEVWELINCRARAQEARYKLAEAQGLHRSQWRFLDFDRPGVFELLTDEDCTDLAIEATMFEED